MAASPCTNSIWGSIKKMILTTAVLCLPVWLERNVRLFTQDKREDEVLLRNVFDCTVLQKMRKSMSKSAISSDATVGYKLKFGLNLFMV